MFSRWFTASSCMSSWSHNKTVCIKIHFSIYQHQKKMQAQKGRTKSALLIWTKSDLSDKVFKAKQICVMGVGMWLYAQLVQMKNKQCKIAIILQCYHLHLSDFCSRPWLTLPYNHITYPGVAGTLQYGPDLVLAISNLVQFGHNCQ